MEQCEVLNKITYRNIGYSHSVQCSKPVFKDGMCKKHFDKAANKELNWIDRPEYRQATQSDLDNGRSLKLSNTNTNRLFMCRNGIIKKWSQKDNRYIPSEYPADFNLFCVLNF